MGKTYRKEEYNERRVGEKKEQVFTFLRKSQGFWGERARTQSPTTTNYAPEFPTFGEIARVSLTEVQWKGLALGEPPC